MVSLTHHNSQHLELAAKAAVKMHSYSTRVWLGSRSLFLEGCYTGEPVKVLML